MIIYRKFMKKNTKIITYPFLVLVGLFVLSIIVSLIMGRTFYVDEVFFLIVAYSIVIAFLTMKVDSRYKKWLVFGYFALMFLMFVVPAISRIVVLKYVYITIMTLITLYLFISGTSNLTKMLRGD